ncbi:MAG: 4Fe-4S binding protein [Syntrophaceae bacterium]|nr:4Fe-4S binding protein [Syntrophaceae bacterium]
MPREIGGQKELQEQVQDAGLCTGCGACVNLCPYQTFYRDRTIVLNPCDIQAGRCYAFCPRTPVDLDRMRRLLSPEADLTREIGPVRSFHIVRAADAGLRRQAQHGGTVSALMSLALTEGLIDVAVVAEGRERFLHSGTTVQEPAEVWKRGKSKFIVSPTVAEFNRTAAGKSEKIGVVATPCQAFALAKMRLKPKLDSGANPIDKLKLTIGLFCGFTLSWSKLTGLLEGSVGLDRVRGMEIPPGEGVLEVYLDDGKRTFPIEEIRDCIRESCRYCVDTTAEFSDLSVGSARLGGSWEETRSWNQVIVRSNAGAALLDLAKARGVLEFHDVPAGSLEMLKEAAQAKKKEALKNLAEKSGRAGDLLYLDAQDRMLAALRS